MNINKLKEHKVVSELKSIMDQNSQRTVKLVGGAVIDILEGRVPKDYDLIVPYSYTDVKKALKTNGFQFQYETNTSRTFLKGQIKVQILKTSVEDFDFKIAQATYSLTDEELTIDEDSFKLKLLIPNSFTDKKAALNSLSRIPHWMNKGYRMKNETYFSLLNCLNDKLVTHINKYPYRS